MNFVYLIVYEIFIKMKVITSSLNIKKINIFWVHCDMGYILNPQNEELIPSIPFPYFPFLPYFIDFTLAEGTAERVVAIE